MQDLERDGAIVFAIMRQKNSRHAATTDLAFDRVRRAEPSLQLILELAAHSASYDTPLRDARSLRSIGLGSHPKSCCALRTF
jgi:hypothetical protein